MGYGVSVPKGRLAVFSVDEEEHAQAVIAHACFPHPVYGWVAQELAVNQTLDHLYAFGDRLQETWSEIENDPESITRLAQRYREHDELSAKVAAFEGVSREPIPAGERMNEMSKEELAERWPSGTKVVMVHPDPISLGVPESDVPGENMSPIDPQDAVFRPGDRVEYVEEFEIACEGDVGTVVAVGAGSGFFGGETIDVMVDGFDYTVRTPSHAVEQV